MSKLNKEGRYWKQRCAELIAQNQELAIENYILIDALERSRVNYPEQFEKRSDLN